MEKLYEYINNDLFDYAMNLCKHNVHDAKDLVQETAIKIARNYSNYCELSIDVQQRICIKTMKNAFLDTRKPRLKNPIAVTDQVDKSTFDKMTSDPILIKEIKDLHKQMIASTEKCIQMFNLFISGYTCAEIASIYQCPLGTVTPNISKGRKKIIQLWLKQHYT